ncbi:hypothetical protein U1Q18_002023 [Sarracenia purpurea var. burkii]
MSGSQISEDGDMHEDLQNVHNGINFSSRLQQFEQMRQQHRAHSKSRKQSRYSSTSSTKEVPKLEDPPRLPVPEMSRPPSRSSFRGLGQ